MNISPSRDWPKLIILIGFLWISALTAFNMFYTFYGWFPLPDQTEQKELWEREEAIDLVRDHATESRDRIANQIYPLLLIFFGLVASFYNEPPKSEPVERGQ